MPAERRVPGEPGFWIIVLGDMAAFTLFFMVFAWYRMQDPALFAAGQATMLRGLGLANTILLLTGSLFVVLGVERARANRHDAPAMFRLGMACGAGFALVKAFEYRHALQLPVDLPNNPFYILYFAFTAVHLLHVLLGIGGLALAQVSAQRERPAERMVLIECAASFWHLVDLLWIVLFALFYLVPA
jgi:nitric oxide reductase NorE protein